MNSEQKILFFDIDGTLLPQTPHVVPKSAVNALVRAKEKGHLLFINSGRTNAMIPEALRELDFDGYVCGCGTEIYMHGQRLFSRRIPNPLCRETVEAMRKYYIGAVFECPDRFLYDGAAPQVSTVAQNMLGRYPLTDLAAFDKEEEQSYTFCKAFLTISSQSDRDAFLAFCKGKYSVFCHSQTAWEIAPEGCSKATGMEFLLKHLNIPRENSFAFGDSPNDSSMLEYAGTSVAMGNSSPEILPLCTYQTTDILEDGIARALEHFGLI